MAKKNDEKGKGRKAILDYLLTNRGRVISGRELQKVSGGQLEWGRRLRELRNEYGYQILSHRDRDDLKQGQYLMETDEQRPAFARGISKEVRAYVLERNGYTCQSCGVGAGDPDPVDSSRKVRLVIGHKLDKEKGGTDDPSNLHAQCMPCNEGLQNIAPMRPDRVHLLSQIRRATKDDQLAALEWLLEKFKRDRT